MAESELGTAQLVLTVDIDAFKASLDDAKKLLAKELGGVAGTGSGQRSPRTRASSPDVEARRAAREEERNTRAQERAEERRQRAIQRGIEARQRAERRAAQEQAQLIARNARQGGAREDTRALEIAQEKRFRLARRVDSLENRGADVARLRVRLGDLTEAQSQRQFGTFRQISQELARQVTLAERRDQLLRRQQRLQQQAAALGASQGGARESVFALERAQDRRFRISQRIERLEDRGVQTAQLRRQLGELTTSYAQRQFGTARQLSRELERQVALTEQRARRERETQRTLERSARIGGAREPVRGRPDLEGSPLFLQQQERERNRAAAQQRRIANEQARLRRQEIAEGLRVGRQNASPIGGLLPGGAVIPDSPAAKARALRLKSSWERFLRQLDETQAAINAAAEREARLQRGPALPVTGRLVTGAVVPGSPADRARQIAQQTVRGPSVPVSGRLINGGVVPGSPAALEAERRLQRERERTARATQRAAEREVQARRKQRSDAIGSGLIGGAFPLLFGQGVGASVGGGLGGVLGGALGGQFGFGLSLIGTAVGAQIDALTQRFIALGEALRDPIANLDKFIQEATLASKSQEALVKALAETGQTQAAADLIRSEASRTLDLVAAEGAAAAQDEFNRALSDTRDVLGTIVSGPARGFLDFLTGTLRFLTGAPPVVGDDPVANSLRSQQSARNRFGLSVGGAAAGAGLLVGGGLLLASGVGAPIGASVLGTGATLLAAGTAGAGVAAGDAAIASSTLKSEQEIRAVKQDQLALERQILQAKAAGKAGLESQLSVQAQFNALKVQELEETQRIRVQLARNLLTPGGDDTEDRAEAQQREADLKRAIDARRQALLDTAKAAEAGSARELRNARELVGVYGTQRDILVEQQRIRAARTAADDAQQELNRQRANDKTDPKALEAQERIVNRLIQERIATELKGLENIRQLDAKRWADAIAAANRVRQIQEETAIQEARPGLTGTGVGALQSLAQFRAAQDAEREAQARLRIAPGDPALLEASQQAAENVRLAAAKTKSDLIEAYKAAEDSVQAITRSIEDAVLALQRSRNDSKQGLNRFLGPQQVADRQAQVNRELTRQAQVEADILGRQGIPVRFTVTGTLEERNRALADFVEAARAERRGSEDINELNQKLIKSINDLSVINEALVNSGTKVAEALPLVQQALENLAEKNWAVNVNVASDGTTSAYGDLVNGAIS